MSARGWRWALASVVGLALGCGRSEATPASEDPAVASPRVVPAPAVDLGEGHAVINLADSFVRYAEAGKRADAAARRALWDATLEAQFPAFFAQVTYRKKEGAERERFKAALIAQFWDEVEPRRERLEAVAAIAAQRVLDGRAAFRKAFPDFDPRCDYFLTVAFSFKGKVVDVDGGNVLALGLEGFDAAGPELDLTIAHEQFHLHHFRTFSASGGLYRGVWSEGLASYASAVLVPNTKLTQILGFDGATVDAMARLSDRLVADVLANMDTSDAALKRAYLGMEPNDTWIPPGSGYYVGLQLVMALARDHDLATMTRWDADTVYRTMKETLPTLSRQ